MPIWWLVKSESVKKRKCLTKIFFSDNVEWSSKNLWKMMSSDVKANIKQWEIRDPVAYITNFCERYLQNLKYYVKRGCIFYFRLVGIPSIFILSVKIRRSGGGFYLNKQNPYVWRKLFVSGPLSFLNFLSWC